MNTDGNVEALNRYMKEQDKAEIAYEAFRDELDDVIGNSIDEIIGLHEEVCNRYSIDEDLCEYIKER